MTAKAKPRKPAGKATSAIPAPEGKPREKSEIEELFTRYKWLEADRDYQAATASSDEEFSRLIRIHDSELDAIAKRLADLQPQTFLEARWLLEFVLPSFTEEGARGDGLDEQVCRNVLESLLEVGRNARDEARDEGYELARKDVNWALELAMNINKERQA
jgi:hypothetical protein